jgi:DNA-directed RNA polymerase subunit M/transcription elongation factor TFIIS
MELYNKIIERYPHAKDFVIHPLLLKEDIIEIDNSDKEICKFCKRKSVSVISVQLRSSDEGETLLNICSNCKKVF